MTFAGTTVDGRFTLVELAGEGGVGVIYRARDAATGATVALKILRRNLEQKDVERFLREGSVIAGLDHPRIVRYVAHGSLPAGEPYLALEWLEGEDLASRVARGPLLSVAEARRLLEHVGDAIAHAHQRGVIHRDLKPSNLFLRGGDLERVTLLDFGLAARRGDLTQTDVVIGTPAYMAPEQARGSAQLGPATDVFSLGCIAYHCLTGHSPFTAEHAVASLSKVLFEEPEPLSDVRPDIPAALDRLVARMLDKDPARRFAGGAELAEALAHLDEALPAVGAPGISRNERSLMSVILAAGDGRPPPALAARLEALGVHPITLVDGSFVVALPALTGRAASDQAAHAVRCALLVGELWPGARVALAAGGGAGGRRRGIGPAAERAGALLAGAGAAGTLAVDEVTAGLVDAHFTVEPLGGDRFRVLAEPEHDDASRPLLGRPTPCVGREPELATIRALVAASASESQAAALLVTGEAGIGKSRLRHELTRELAAVADPPRVFFGRPDPLAPGAPFGLLADVAARAGAARLIETLRAGDGVAAAAVAWLAGESTARPVLLVLEELQWADRETLRVLDEALHALRDEPFCVLGFARPEVAALVPDLFTGRPLVRIDLRPLGPRAAEELVRAALGEDAPAASVARIVERAEGNALYLEELVRAVAEGRGDHLPETMLAMLHARLLAFPPEARRVLRAASVFGARPTRRGVERVLGLPPDDPDTGRWLDTLCDAEVLERRPGEEHAYAWRHLMLRDAAYTLFLEEDRVEAHRLAARRD